MELAEQDFSDMNNLSTKLFQKLLAITARTLISDTRRHEMDLSQLKTQTLSVYELKKMSGQLFSFLSEVCKTDATNELIQQTLDDYQLQKSHQNQISACIAKYKPKIRAKLAETSVEISQLIGIEWRLCQDIKQRQLSRINKPSYLIKLKFQDGEKIFECGFEQLQDLVAKLKTARNAAIRLLDQQ